MRQNRENSMKRAPASVALVLASLSLSSACHSRASGMQRNQENYDVVQEGSANGVSSTIAAPGEPALYNTALTGTSADTTTNLTIGTSTDPTATSGPGSLANTLPSTTSPGGLGY